MNGIRHKINNQTDSFPLILHFVQYSPAISHQALKYVVAVVTEPD